MLSSTGAVQGRTYRCDAGFWFFCDNQSSVGAEREMVAVHDLWEEVGAIERCVSVEM